MDNIIYLLYVFEDCLIKLLKIMVFITSFNSELAITIKLKESIVGSLDSTNDEILHCLSSMPLLYLPG